eukprot:5691714-Amphidinium_carterae.1
MLRLRVMNESFELRNHHTMNKFPPVTDLTHPHPAPALCIIMKRLKVWNNYDTKSSKNVISSLVCNGGRDRNGKHGVSASHRRE